MVEPTIIWNARTVTEKVWFFSFIEDEEEYSGSVRYEEIVGYSFPHEQVYWDTPTPMDVEEIENRLREEYNKLKNE